jgi:hypothetical protein
MDQAVRDPAALVVVRVLKAARPFGAGDLLELPWREAEGLIAQQVVELAPVSVAGPETR